MDQAGYLVYTSARREDGEQSANLLLSPILEHLSQGPPPSLDKLIANTNGWADGLLELGRRHLRKGIGVAMFLGCFKAFLWAMQDALNIFYEIDCKELSPDIENARVLLGMYGHAFEIIWVDSVMAESVKGNPECQAVVNPMLAVEKHRFENVFNASSDGILIMDHDCRITSSNAKLEKLIGYNACGMYVWEPLGMHTISSKEELFKAFPPGAQFEAPLFNSNHFFKIDIASLGQFSLAHRNEYIVCIGDITHLVQQRELLQTEVNRQTADLVREKQLLEEMNITMRNIIKVTNDERATSLENTAQSIRKFIGPALRKVVAENGLLAREAYAQLLIEHLERLLKPEQAVQGQSTAENKAVNGFKLDKLTITELKICQLVQAGHTSKVIADLLNISMETVKTHRRSIRRKLNLRGSDSQLGTYLVQQHM